MIEEYERVQCCRCYRFYTHDTEVEAILAWGYCLGCDKLDLIPLENAYGNA